jgi:hypothetical protein
MIMFCNPMMRLAGGVQRVDMNRGVGKIPQLMQESMPNLSGDLVSLLDRPLRNCESYQPAAPHFPKERRSRFEIKQWPPFRETTI